MQRGGPAGLRGARTAQAGAGAMAGHGDAGRGSRRALDSGRDSALRGRGRARVRIAASVPLPDGGIATTLRAGYAAIARG